MKPFLRKLAILLAAQLLLGVLVWWRYRSDPQTYVAATIDKHERLDSLQGGRLILVGGSNVAMGLSAELMAGQLAMPAVNMALHADVGRDFMLAEVRDKLRAGDVVVLSFEYQLFGGPPATTTLAQLLELRPESVEYLSPRLLPSFSDEGLTLLGERVRRAVIGRKPAAAPYSRGSFSAFGDGQGHHGMPPRRPLKPFYFSGLTDDSIAATSRALEAFAAHAAARESRVFYSYPPIPEASLAEHRDDVLRIARQLQTARGLTIVDQPRAMPPSCFFDTAYHLTQACTDSRSRSLALTLDQRLKDQLPARR